LFFLIFLQKIKKNKPISLQRFKHGLFLFNYLD
jgi:hypothetical protein